MFIKEGSLLKYKYIYCDLHALYVKCTQNPTFSDSLVSIVSIHRGRTFNLFEFGIEYFRHKEDKQKMKFLIITDKNKIISISRVSYNTKQNVGILALVHTLQQYRGQGLCQLNIKKLIKYTQKRSKITFYKLGVDVSNTTAVKCYQKCGFKIKNTIKEDDMEDSYSMTLKIK